MAATAAEIMTSPAITITPEASIGEVAELLASKHISALPVCYPDGTLAGLVSEADIIKPFCESARLRRDWWLGILAEGEELSQDFLDYVRRDTRSISTIAARQVVTAGEEATLPELAELMTTHRVKRLPIVRNGRVTGIVSRSDLVAALARAPATLV